MKIFLSPILYLVSRVYLAGLCFDRWRRTRQSKRLGSVVISVGNITVGGTGKTPLVIRLASDLKNQKRFPAILTRGYRGFLAFASEAGIGVRLSGDISSRCISLDGSTMPGIVMSDEVNLMLEKLADIPIGIGSDRIKTAEAVVKRYKPDVFILDDGFQHWDLHRDLDIVCIDATDPWGGGILPLGRLREPLTTMKRADCVVLTRTELVSEIVIAAIEKKIKAINPNIELFRTEMKPSLWSVGKGTVEELSSLSGMSVVALSALARPQAFEKVLKRNGAHVVSARFQDHHLYSDSDLSRIETTLKETAGIVVTTEKDWVKLSKTRWGIKNSLLQKMFILKIEIVFPNNGDVRWLDYLEKKTHEI